MDRCVKSISDLWCNYCEYLTVLGLHFVSFSQQPARFSNRCLQTIGRCWPHLRALGVGGAGCGIQGLASLGKSYRSVATIHSQLFIIAAFYFTETAYMLFLFLGASLMATKPAFKALYLIPTLPHTHNPLLHLFTSPFSTTARNCMRLQVLELDHVSEINQEVAAEVCREGLKGLEMLVLTSTPVTPKALLHFNSEYMREKKKSFFSFHGVVLCPVYVWTDAQIVLPLM